MWQAVNFRISLCTRACAWVGPNCGWLQLWHSIDSWSGYVFGTLVPSTSQHLQRSRAEIGRHPTHRGKRPCLAVAISGKSMQPLQDPLESGNMWQPWGLPIWRRTLQGSKRVVPVRSLGGVSGVHGPDEHPKINKLIKTPRPAISFSGFLSSPPEVKLAVAFSICKYLGCGWQGFFIKFGNLLPWVRGEQDSTPTGSLLRNQGMRKKGTWRCGWPTGCKRTNLTTNLSSWTFTWETWHFICFWLAPNGIPDTLSHQSLPPTTRMLAGRGGNDYAFHSQNHPPNFQPFWFGKYLFFYPHWIGVENRPHLVKSAQKTHSTT